MNFDTCFRITTFSMLLVLFSCSHAEKNNEAGSREYAPVMTRTDLDDSKEYNALMEKAMLTGDTNAYAKLAGYHFVNDMPDKFFFYSFRFANKYHYPAAYYDLYTELSESGQRGVDSISVLFAFYCLTKSYEMGYTVAKDKIDELEKGCACRLHKSDYYLLKFNTSITAH